MKLIHIADSHFGKVRFNKTTPDGANLFETLCYENARVGAQHIIDQRPDVIVDGGDRYNSVTPKTISIIIHQEILQWYEEAGIEVVQICGNHDMPKMAHVSCPLEITAHSNKVHSAHSYRYQRIEIQDTIFHLVPNMLHAEDYRTAMKEVEISSCHNNVLVTHGLASTIRDKRLSSAAECELGADILLADFDQILLGHYHGQEQVAPNAWYSGSQEYLAYGEIDNIKGALVVDPARHTVEHLDLPHIPMMDLGTIHSAELSAEQLADIINRKAEGLPENTMARVTLDFMDFPVRIVPEESLTDVRDRLLDLNIRVKSQETERAEIQQQDLKGINYVDEFSAFLQQRTLTDKQRADVLARGIETLKTVVAEREVSA
ncbi:MAG: metallophosphoesterase [Methanoregula sp.]|nr:metallophosphoesterase [Methanoregula sp.]